MRDLTRGDILRSLIAFTIPVFVATSLQTVYNIVDALWVAQLGAEAIAAVSVSYVIVIVLLSVSWGTTSAVTAIVSQSFGAGDRDRVARAGANALLLIGGLAVVLGAVVAAANRIILTWLGTPAEVLDAASVYLVISALTMPFMYAGVITQAALRGVGDSVSPMTIGVVANALNLVLDPLLIFGWAGFPRLEVAGAAWATLIARGVAAAWGIGVMQRREVTRMRLRDFRPDGEIVRPMVRIGVPSGVTSLVQSMANSVVMGLVTPFGTPAVAAHGIGQRVDLLLVMPAVAMGLSAAPMIGQSLGAGRTERAYAAGKLALYLIFGFLTTIGALTFLFAPWIVWPFAPRDPEIVRVAALYFRIQGLFYGFLGILLVMNHMLRGAGDAWASLVLSVASLWVLRIPAASFFANTLGLGVAGVWWGIDVSLVVGSAAAMLYYRSRRWMRWTVVRRQAGAGAAARGGAEEAAPGLED